MFAPLRHATQRDGNIVRDTSGTRRAAGRGRQHAGGGPLSGSDLDDGLAEFAEAVRVMRRHRAVLEALFTRSPVPTAVIDAAGRLSRVNDALCAFLGRSADELLGSPMYELTASEEYGPVGPGTSEQRFEDPNGEDLWAVVHAVDLPESGEGVMLVTFDDTTSRRHNEQLLLHAALHDSLTNLPNRRLLRDRLDTALSRAARSDTTVAVLFVDLNDFKKVNDGFGHEVGDAVLVAVARNVISALRTCDTVARIGGDEFVVVCEDVAGEGDISRLVDRVLTAIRRPVRVGDHTTRLSASIGVALPSPAHEDSDSLVRMADLAMYRAKQQPDVDYVLADESLARLGSPGAGLPELRHAIQANLLQLHYQPVVSVDGLLIGLEALVRWPHPERGLLLPRDFLHIAEGSDLAGPLTDWVLRTAIAEAANWPDPAVQLSVNMWASEVARPGFAQNVQELLDWAGLAPESLRLEMHEEDLQTAGPALADELAALRELGCGLTIDDYGTGDSSLAHLRRLPVDTLKLDRMFVAGLMDNADDSAVIEAVASAARATGRRLAATGVENRAQLRRLRDLGFDGVQGYLTGAPAPLPELRELLRRRRVDIR
jgi:diguanylate cyclase (GGDEF)-like protein/PAS domain S-box-containing protein